METNPLCVIKSIFAPALLDLYRQLIEGEIDLETFESEIQNETEYVKIILNSRN